MLHLQLTAPTVMLANPGAPAPLEAPLTFSCSARYSDASLPTALDLRRSGIYVYRTLSAGAAEEIWDAQGKRWQSPPADPATLMPLPFDFKDGQAEPWQAMLVAFGQKDGAGRPAFSSASGGYPSHRARAYLAVNKNGQLLSALSGPSPGWTFASARESARFAASFDTESAKDTTRARFELKDAALRSAGYLEIRAAGANALEISACDANGTTAATIVLSMNGEIRLRPASGSRVLIDGDLECNRITYLSPGAITRGVLP